MKRVVSWSFVLSIPLLFVAGGWFVLGPLHDRQGKRNTQYSSKFSPAAFFEITNGMSFDALTNQFGVPFQTEVKNDYPAWAVRTDKFRKERGHDAKIRIEWLHFSREKKTPLDFDLVEVVLGPYRTVIDKRQWVTD